MTRRKNKHIFVNLVDLSDRLKSYYCYDNTKYCVCKVFF